MAEAGGLWDEARTDELRRLWQAGCSAGQIADRLSEPGRPVTRNTICGKLHRLGLKGRPANASPPVPAAMAAPEPSAPRLLRAVDPAPAPPQAAPPRPIQAVTPSAEPGGPLPDLRRVTIQELAGDMCRWPLGDPSAASFRYCGNASLAGRPYCGHHAVMAYEPPRQRSSR